VKTRVVSVGWPATTAAIDQVSTTRSTLASDAARLDVLGEGVTKLFVPSQRAHGSTNAIAVLKKLADAVESDEPRGTGDENCGFGWYVLWRGWVEDRLVQGFATSAMVGPHGG
jgi:hypothetical protein